MSTTLLWNLSIQRSVTLVLVPVIAYFAFKFTYSLIRPFWSPLRTLPGPKSSSFFWGHLQEIFKSGPSEAHLKWAYEYGPTYVCSPSDLSLI